MATHRRHALAALAVMVTCGCGGPNLTLDANVTGAVTLDGELVDSGNVAFHPIDGGPVAYGTVRPDGSYSVRTGRGDLEDPDVGGLPAGQYVVTVVVKLPPVEGSSIGEGEGGPPVPGARISPEKYATVENSPLVVRVRSGDNVIPLEMKREPVDDAKSDTAGEDEADESAEADAASETDQTETSDNIPTDAEPAAPGAAP